MSAPVWRRRRHADRVRRALARADRTTDLTVAWVHRHLPNDLPPWQVDDLRTAFRAMAIRDERARMHARSRRVGLR